jgi:regulator of protease activity HflC (stomatin/prohibitin superfamily)
MDTSQFLFLAVAIAIVILVVKGVKIVPQQQAWVVEHLGKFDCVLEPGLNFINPFFAKVSYKFSLKEQPVDVRSQTAITKDNVSLTIDGIVYVRITDPKLAAYGVEDPFFAVIQLAQTTMRSEIGKMSLDNTFEEREHLNLNIVNSINQAAQSWGIQCMRYEIRDINPPTSILQSMEQQVTAEREKRALILDSEGKRQAAINIAEGERQRVVLNSEAAMIDQTNRAKGEALAILSVADATAKGIETIAAAIQNKGGTDAVSLKIAEKYVEAFREVAKQSTTLLLPANAHDAGSMVAQAMGVFDTVRKQKQG